MRRRLVVVGNGMAGTRLVEELLARGGGERWDVTVVGDEPHEAYNRINLSGVLAGTHREDDLLLQPPGWYAEAGVRAVLGTRAVRVHRSTRTVHLADGSWLPYDGLVLATGATPVLPPLPGIRRADPLTGEWSLHPQVVAFRTLDDCRLLTRAAQHSRRAVVVGGGLLGLEAARGLTARGVAVEVVHVAEWLMNGQLDPEAGEVLRRTLAGIGISSYVGARATHVLCDDDGGLSGLRLADGHVLDCDLVVVAAGVRPAVRLAREARLPVRRGILVDSSLSSVADPAVHAIGDCAEVVASAADAADPQGRGECTGLVGPAWDQAAVLAGVLAAGGPGPAARYVSRPVVTRLKASGIEVAAMGEVAPVPADTDRHRGGDLEVVAFSDYARGVYKKVVVRAGRVVGGLLVGDVGSVGTLTLAFDRGTPVPTDRLHLLFEGAFAGAGGGVGADPASLADEATVCHCNSVTAGRIREVAREARAAGSDCDAACVAGATRATTGCGTCRGAVTAILSAVGAEPVQDSRPADPPGSVPAEVAVSA